MSNMPVYMDNQATTRVDPRVLETMLPYFDEKFGNAGSTSHAHGWECREAVEQARRSIGESLGASGREIVFTSGATESNNLAIRGAAQRQRRRGDHLVTVKTEHKSVLDPITRLVNRGFEATYVPVQPHASDCAGRVEVERVLDALRDDTLMVSIMLANNEIGVLQSIAEIGTACRERGILFHTDATQAVGKIPIDVTALHVDLMSFSAHKIYGPKGVGALYVRRRGGSVKLTSQIDGGSQELGLRSGTLNVPGIVAMARALELCIEEMESEQTRLCRLRDRLFDGLRDAIPDIQLNGPDLRHHQLRLAGSLNCSFPGVDGEALMMSMREIAVSSGSACTSANPEPSHVLRALGMDADRVRSSLRFGLGRFNTPNHIDVAIESVSEAVHRLRKLRADP